MFSSTVFYRPLGNIKVTSLHILKYGSVYSYSCLALILRTIVTAFASAFVSTLCLKFLALS